ncbi:PIF1 family ATP-dependent DNA helicase [Phaeodactylibacter sp.]|uniref:ATP-dependent DNA helicase n=2 Tax=Phaeodactylibacter sp. TaxID=1940289 RepID=UPI0025DCF353|nr:PIF1 family ATP-dependent DNA helicase [Phaeodactylibacter sp.]
MAFEKAPLELSGDFKAALQMIENEGRNVFITGRAGTGKSTLLQLFRNTTRKKTVVLAPTGIAALNVGGQTIHSFFGFPPKPLSRQDLKKRRNRRLYTNLEVLVIDEISMVRADMLDNIDWFLRINREVPAPFGGLQVVFFGDMFQLPPVVANDIEAMRFQLEYDSPYFFSAHLFQDQTFFLEMMELNKVYRQENRNFLRLLESVRLNRLDYDDLEDLNSRHLPQFEPEDFYVTLSARNATVDRINQRELSRIPLEEKTYVATISGQFNPRLYPTDPALKLKLGAQVMFIKNDPDKRFVNGTIGKVIKLDKKNVTVQIEQADGTPTQLEVEPMEWEVVKYKPSEKDPNRIETETLGNFTQLPLRLAWAITIHKSQGKTFDKVIIDLGRGAFEHGQTYVALSRCRSLEGIVLKTPLRMQDILIDERVVQFYETHF